MLSIVEKATLRRCNTRGVFRAFRGTGVVTIHTEQSNPTEVGVLVVQEKPLCYNLLIGIGAIQSLDGTILHWLEMCNSKERKNHLQQSPLMKMTSVLLLTRKRKSVSEP